MKFRAKLVDPVSIREFARMPNPSILSYLYRKSLILMVTVCICKEVVSLLGRQGKQCVMRIQPSQVHLIMLESGAVGGVLVWAELDANNFFSEYNMDGVTPEHNEILLEFETGLFLPF